MSTEKPTPTVPLEQVSSTEGMPEAATVENPTPITETGHSAPDTVAVETEEPDGVLLTGDVSDDPAVVAAVGAQDNGQSSVAGETPYGETRETVVDRPSGPEGETEAVTESHGGAGEEPQVQQRPEGTREISVGQEIPDSAGADETVRHEVLHTVDIPGDAEVTDDTLPAGGDIETAKEAPAAQPDMEEATAAVDAAATDTADEPEAGTAAPETLGEDFLEQAPAATDDMEPKTTLPEATETEPVGPLTEAEEPESPAGQGGLAEPTEPAPVRAAAAEQEQVDFSDEEAELDKLAAQKPEFDLGEEEESELAHESISGVDSFATAGKSKSQLLDVFAVLLAERPVQTIHREVEAIKVAFYRLLRAGQEELRHKFISEGGQPEDFAPPVDNDEERLKDLFREYRKRRDEFIAQLDRSKEENLKIKLKVVEDLKELVNSSETLGNTFSAFRELQQRWRDAGPVPQANVKDLWETYNHYVENFYSYIKINKELRDLDLKKNYEAKVALCEEAEALILEPFVINSFHRLQKLHEQWRETGPVANEYKEALWERFREASSRINKQHQEYFDRQKDEQKLNLDLKTELCVKTEELASGVWITRKEWNRASDRLLEIQKVWKTIGFAPKKDNARIYERFRNACDRFFEQKRLFYQQVKLKMELNLQMKNELCVAAEAIQDSEDWKKTTDELIALQKKWKEVGPVARRHSDAVWKRFRAACDHFFGRKAQHFASKDSEQEENLRLKKELLAEISAADIQAGGFEVVKEFQRRWSEIGFVPIKQKDAIQKEYKEAMDQAFSTLWGSGQAIRMDRFRDKVRNMKTSGDKRLRFERDRLYNKVKQMESEIALLENNIGFFSNSKNAESMIRDVKEKIERTREEMAAAIEKINLIDSQEE